MRNHDGRQELKQQTVHNTIEIALVEVLLITEKPSLEDTERNMEKYDLTSHISPYLDRHMVFPLLEYLDTLIGKDSIGYNTKDVAAARLSLLRPTHMVDYAMDIYKSVHGEKAEVPKEMQEQKDGVYKELERLRKGCEVLENLCKDGEERVSSRFIVREGGLDQFSEKTRGFLMRHPQL
jgi:hypothetical protein